MDVIFFRLFFRSFWADLPSGLDEMNYHWKDGWLPHGASGALDEECLRPAGRLLFRWGHDLEVLEHRFCGVKHHEVARDYKEHTHACEVRLKQVHCLWTSDFKGKVASLGKRKEGAQQRGRDNENEVCFSSEPSGSKIVKGNRHMGREPWTLVSLFLSWFFVSFKF